MPFFHGPFLHNPCLIQAQFLEMIQRLLHSIIANSCYDIMPLWQATFRFVTNAGRGFMHSKLWAAK